MPALQREVFKRFAVDTAGQAYARTLRKTHDLTAEQFNAFQHKQLFRTYTNAIARVPYYKTRSHLYPTVSQDNFLQHFQQLPVLDKQTVKAQTTEFIQVPRSRFLLQLTTSGTTGTPLVIYQSPFERVKSNALRQSVYAKFCNLVAPRILDLSASLESGQVMLNLPGTRHAYLSIYHLVPKHRAHIVELLRDFRPELIQGFPSAMAQLARLLPDGLPYQLPNRTVRCVTTSETLFPDTHRMLEDTLGVLVHNEYGSQEGQHYAFSCAQGSMHIHPVRGYVEILAFDRDAPVPAGEAGRVVVTGFQNRHMPLIRYCIGDSASKAPDGYQCPCGSGWPVLLDLQGRTQDLVRTRDGNRIGLIEAATLRNIAGITESQIIQTGYESFTYRIVTSQAYDTSHAESLITQLLTDRLGHPVEVTFEYVTAIGKTSSGKHRAVIVDF